MNFRQRYLAMQLSDRWMNGAKVALEGDEKITRPKLLQQIVIYLFILRQNWTNVNQILLAFSRFDKLQINFESISKLGEPSRLSSSECVPKFGLLQALNDREPSAETNQVGWPVRTPFA